MEKISEDEFDKHFNYRYYKNRDRLSGIIERCNKKNLKDSSQLDFKKAFNIKVNNAKRMEHYILDKGINVYKLYNDDGQVIDTFISGEELLDEECNFLSDKSFFEYSPMGGLNNSLMYNGVNYYNSEHFKIVMGDNRYYDADLLFSKGYMHVLNIEINQAFMRSYRNERCEPLQNDFDMADVINYINEDPHEYKSLLLDGHYNHYQQLKELINNIDLVLSTQDKKGFLSGLLSRYKKVNDALETKQEGRGR
jgi:hypothetical protein